MFKYVWNNGCININEIDIPENIEEFLDHKGILLKPCSYSLVPEYTNHFLTAKAGEEHLISNNYHYHKNADVYLNHAWRNPEMEMVSEFLCGLVGKEPHK